MPFGKCGAVLIEIVRCNVGKDREMLTSLSLRGVHVAGQTAQRTGQKATDGLEALPFAFCCCQPVTSWRRRTKRLQIRCSHRFNGFSLWSVISSVMCKIFLARCFVQSKRVTSWQYRRLDRSTRSFYEEPAGGRRSTSTVRRATRHFACRPGFQSQDG